MSNKEKIPGTDEAWESEQLGADAKHVRRADPAIAEKIDDALGLQMISIRLEKSLIESFKILAEFHGVGYQPLMRDALKHFANHEMKAIVTGVVDSQKNRHAPKQSSEKASSPRDKKAA